VLKQNPRFSQANKIMNEKQRLQKIIDDHAEPAENGSILSRMYVISSQMELDKIAQNELADYVAHTPLPDPLILVD
jgi:hypothetical protein